MTNEMPGSSELTNTPSSPNLKVRVIYMPDSNSESTSRTPVLERPRVAPVKSSQRAKEAAREAAREVARRARETGERPPQMRGDSPLSVGSVSIKEDIKKSARDIDPSRFSDRVHRGIAETIKRAGESADGSIEERFLRSDTLEDFGQVVMDRLSADPDVDPEQAAELRRSIKELLGKANISEGRVGRDELPEEAQARYVRKTIEDNERKIANLEAKGALRTPEEERELHERRNLEEYLKLEYKKKLKVLVTNLPLQEQGLHRATIELIAADDEALEYLINRLVSIPLDYELGKYNLGFWGGNNLETVKTFLQTRATSGGEDSEHARERYLKLLVVSNSIEFFHTMNSLIVQGNLEGFVRIAENITPDQLQMMQGVLGSSLVMRLLDQEYQLLLSRDEWINNDNYGKMMGFVIENEPDPERPGMFKGRIVKNYHGSVFNKFKAEVESAKRTRNEAEEALLQARNRGASQQELNELMAKTAEANENDLSNMADWEISWAYNVGKILHNLSLRPAEYISQGKNPEGAEQYASFPQEGMARLMNWMNEMMFRFDVAKERGGVKLSDFVMENYQKIKTTDGYFEPRISEIMGKKLAYFELPAVFEVSGPMSSWRQTLMILRQIPFDIGRLGALIKEEDIKKPEGEKVTIGHLVDTKLIKWWKDANDARKARFFREIFLDQSGNLRTDINSALGVLLKNSALAPSDDPDERKKNKQFEAVKLEIRKAIWKRVAEDNPLAILPYLNGLKYKDDTNLDRGIDREIKILGKGGKAEALEVDYEKFSKKIFKLNEIRMQKIRREKTYDNPSAGYESLQALIDRLKRERKLEWSDGEQGLLEYIQLQGKAASGDFANVRFNFNPFMNDVLFEQMVYGEAGAEFYRRRAAGDLGSLSKAVNAYIAIANNPAGLSIEDFGKHIMEIVDGIGSPLGTDTGIRKAVPIQEAWIEFGSRGSNDWDKIGIEIGIGPIKILQMLDLKKKRRVFFTEKQFNFENVHKVVNSPIVKAVRGYGPVNWTLSKFNKFNSWAQHYSGDAKGHAWSVPDKEDIIHHLSEIGATNHRWALYLRKRFSGKGRWKFFLYLFTNILPIGLIAGGVDLGKRPFSEGEEFKS